VLLVICLIQNTNGVDWTIVNPGDDSFGVRSIPVEGLGPPESTQTLYQSKKDGTEYDPYGSWTIMTNGDMQEDPFMPGNWSKTIHATDGDGVPPWATAYPVGRYKLTIGIPTEAYCYFDIMDM
jgi:hypothetical protein